MGKKREQHKSSNGSEVKKTLGTPLKSEEMKEILDELLGKFNETNHSQNPVTLHQALTEMFGNDGVVELDAELDDLLKIQESVEAPREMQKKADGTVLKDKDGKVQYINWNIESKKILGIPFGPDVDRKDGNALQQQLVKKVQYINRNKELSDLTLTVPQTELSGEQPISVAQVYLRLFQLILRVQQKQELENVDEKVQYDYELLLSDLAYALDSIDRVINAYVARKANVRQAKVQEETSLLTTPETEKQYKQLQELVANAMLPFYRLYSCAKMTATNTAKDLAQGALQEDQRQGNTGTKQAVKISLKKQKHADETDKQTEAKEPREQTEENKPNEKSVESYKEKFDKKMSAINTFKDIAWKPHKENKQRYDPLKKRSESKAVNPKTDELNAYFEENSSSPNNVGEHHKQDELNEQYKQPQELATDEMLSFYRLYSGVKMTATIIKLTRTLENRLETYQQDTTGDRQRDQDAIDNIIEKMHTFLEHFAYADASLLTPESKEVLIKHIKNLQRALKADPTITTATEDKDLVELLFSLQQQVGNLISLTQPVGNLKNKQQKAAEKGRQFFQGAVGLFKQNKGGRRGKDHPVKERKKATRQH